MAETGQNSDRSQLGPGLSDGDGTRICCPLLSFPHQRESPSKIPLWGGPPPMALCGPLLPSSSSPWSLLAGEGPGILGLPEGSRFSLEQLACPLVDF